MKLEIKAVETVADELTGPEHFRESERLMAVVLAQLDEEADDPEEPTPAEWSAIAATLQVIATLAHTHATLAHAAAVATLDAIPVSTS